MLDNKFLNNLQEFNCIRVGSDQKPLPTKIIKAYNEVSSPLDSSLIETLQLEFNGNNSLIDLYTHYGDIGLYCDPITEYPTILIAHPSLWGELKEGFDLWVQGLSDEERKELLPEWIDSTIIFGELSGSGDCYLYLLEGDEKGSIYEFNHDGFEFNKLADNMNEFLEFVTTPDDKLISYISAYCRFSDEHNDAQWMPV